MASVVDHLNKLREERVAREKARIEKLRQLNLKKYSNNDHIQMPKASSSSVSIQAKTRPEASVAPTTSRSDTNTNKSNLKRPTVSRTSANKDSAKAPTNNFKAPNKLNENNKAPALKAVKECGDSINGDRRVSKQVGPSKIIMDNVKPVHKVLQKTNMTNNTATAKVENVKNAEAKVVPTNIPKIVETNESGVILEEKDTMQTTSKSINGINDKQLKIINEKQDEVKKSNLKTSIPTPKANGSKKVSIISKNNFNSRKSIAVMPKIDSKPKFVDRRKTMLPQQKEQGSNVTTNTKESVFDRLYKPKTVHKAVVDNVTKLKTDPNYLKKVIKESQKITNTNRRYTTFENKAEVRRSISAIHFKRVHKSELSNCIHKWASIGNNINKEDVQDIDEDETLKEEKVISAVKSERKRVKFQTPLPLYFNTPKPEELQTRLQNWLKKRGKSLDSYHHLQCFGLHHLSNGKPIDPPKFDDVDENKENIALEHDSDNESFLENNNKNGNLEDEARSQFPADAWRRVSSVTDTSDFNESYVSTMTSGEIMHHVDELLIGALQELTELLREGYDWQSCARWLRALRERFPDAPESAPYWECRAALEERRGDLHATVQCLEEALTKGTEQSVVEANLDSLLNKFMQLKISPSSRGEPRRVDPKLVDVKNVFKSTIIRFAVQQAKLRQSSGTPKYTVTPVRRSHRLSRTHTPLRVCSSVHQASELGAEFRPNKALLDSP